MECLASRQRPAGLAPGPSTPLRPSPRNRPAIAAGAARRGFPETDHLLGASALLPLQRSPPRQRSRCHASTASPRNAGSSSTLQEHLSKSEDSALQRFDDAPFQPREAIARPRELLEMAAQRRAEEWQRSDFQILQVPADRASEMPPRLPSFLEMPARHRIAQSEEFSCALRDHVPEVLGFADELKSAGRAARQDRRAPG